MQGHTLQRALTRSGNTTPESITIMTLTQILHHRAAQPRLTDPLAGLDAATALLLDYTLDALTAASAARDAFLDAESAAQYDRPLDAWTDAQTGLTVLNAR